MVCVRQLYRQSFAQSRWQGFCMLLVRGGALPESRTVKKSKDFYATAPAGRFLFHAFIRLHWFLFGSRSKSISQGPTWSRTRAEPPRLLPPVSAYSHSYSLRPHALPQHRTPRSSVSSCRRQFYYMRVVLSVILTIDTYVLSTVYSTLVLSTVNVVFM